MGHLVCQVLEWNGCIYALVKKMGTPTFFIGSIMIRKLRLRLLILMQFAILLRQSIFFKDAIYMMSLSYVICMYSVHVLIIFFALQVTSQKKAFPWKVAVC